MIVIDTSALIAIFEEEPEAERYLEAISLAETPVISAATLVEANIVMLRRHGLKGGRRLAAFIREAGIQVESVDATQAQVAIDAFETYGKGMGHKAGLNFGDCFSYALAKETGLPLLYKGKDFSLTDLASALLTEPRP